VLVEPSRTSHLTTKHRYAAKKAVWQGGTKWELMMLLHPERLIVPQTLARTLLSDFDY
jgi:hypothetical protein